MAVADEVEEMLNDIGFGRWQWMVLFTTIAVQLVCPVQQLGSPLLSAPLPFRCSVPNHQQADNGTQYGINKEDEIQYPSKCNPEKEFTYIPLTQQSNNSGIVVNKQVTGLPSCPEIEYDTSIFQSTVTTEWNLVCEASSLRPIFQMAYSIGGFIGSAICGQLSDRLGRKKALQMGSLIMTLSILATSVVPWYTVMIALRILTGIATRFVVFPGYTLLSEVSPKKHRTITSIICGMSYYVGMAAFAGVGYLQPHWRKLTLLCNSPVLLMIPLTFIIDESPRWLIQKGRGAEAAKILRNAAKKNGAWFSSSTSKSIDNFEGINTDSIATKDNQEGGENGIKNTFALVRTCYTLPGMRIILILLPLMWFFQRSQYVGIIINANNFASSHPFGYVALSAAMGIIAMALAIPLSAMLPRRVFLAGTLSLSGVLMLAEIAIPTECWMIQWFTVMAAFCLSCGAFQVNYIYAVELYPTLIRTRGFTFSSLVGAIGEMTMPLVTDIAVEYYWWAADVTFGLAGVIGSFLLPFLPETKNHSMPETLQDVEDRYWRGTRKVVHHNQNPEEGVAPENEATQPRRKSCP